MKARGWIGAEEYRRALIALGSEKHSPLVSPDMAPGLPQGSALYLMSATASLLADAGVLESACRFYRIYVDECYINEARSARDSVEHATRLDECIGRLLRRISDGIESGVYQCAQIPDGQPAAERGQEMDVIYDLMLAANQPGDVLWIDDRWLNSYLRSDAAPIIGISEAIGALRRRELISEQYYYDKLLKLRAGNIRYIPITAEEILYRLNHASIAEGALISTPELRTLKKYLAGCLLDAEALQIPPLIAGAPNPVGEMAFVFDTKSAVEAAIARVWRNDQASAEELEARADWLLGNLYTGIGGLRHLLPHLQDSADPARLLGLDIGGMFTIGCLSIIDPVLENETAGRLSRFADWFEERFLIPRVIADPEVAQIAGMVISAFINDAAHRRYEGRDHEQVARLANSLLYEHMPDILKAHVKLDRDVMEWIGMRADCVAIEGVGFDHAEFAHAVEDIMGGAPNAHIRALDSDAEYRLKRMPDEDGIPVVGVFAQGAEDGPVWRIKDAILAMASPDSAAREVSLRTNKRWLDCDRERFEQAVREINGIEDLMTRMRKVQDWRDESAEVHYRNFAYKLGRTYAFQWAELIPFSAEGLLRHYRLPADASSDGDFREALERSALTLLDEEGLETALERLARLPVIIPDALAQELGSLPGEERSAIIEGCASRWASPVGKLNLAHIILRFPSQNGDLTRVAISAIEGLFDEEGKPGFDLFKALLDFTYDRFSLWKEVQAWAPSLKLAMVWAHAVRLYDVFHSVSGPAATAELAKAFESYNRDRGSINILRRQTSLWNDALHPRRFSKAVFLTHGVASVLDGASFGEPDKLRVRDRILSVSSPSPENSNWVPLLCDYTRGSNCTNSYLGGNHEAISRIIGDDAADHLAPSKLEGMALEAIQKLKDDAAGRDWCTLEILSMELPFRPEVSSHLNALIERTDYLALFEGDQRDALSALRVTINQAYYTNDEKLRSRIEEVLFSRMKSAFRDRDGSPVSPAESGDPSGKQAQGLTDIAFRLAFRESDQRTTVADFSRLMISFLHFCPSASAYFDAGLSQFLRPLPTEGLQEMWKFWLTVRAS